MGMMSPGETVEQPEVAEVRCQPCRQTWRVLDLENPRRCAKCGGPTVSMAQLEQFKQATSAALAALKARSTSIMRMTSFSMLSVQIVTYFIDDRTTATFFNDVVTTAAAASTIATEVWAFTGSKLWMVLASLCIQIAAIMFFFVAVAVFNEFVDPRSATMIACLPMAGSLAAWHQFRAYLQLMRLNQKKR